MIKIESPKPFLTIEDVARILDVNAITVKRLIESGQLRSFKVGKMYRIEKGDLGIYLESNTTSPLTETKIIKLESEEKDNEH